MSRTRRSPAPDIAACIVVLFGISIFFALLKAFYSHSVSEALPGIFLYGGLDAVCAVLARGLFLRLPFAAPASLVALAVAALAAITGFYLPETTQLPAGMLSLLGIALLLATLGEFAPRGDAPEPDGDNDDDA